MPGVSKIEFVPPPDDPQPNIVAISPVEIDGGDDVEPTQLTLFNNDQFQERVRVIQKAIEDPEKFRQCVAEIHTYLSLFEEGFRNMGAEMMLSGGPFAFLRKMMGRGKN